MTITRKSLKKQLKQFGIKFIIALICCSTLCLICYLIESTNGEVFIDVDHSSEKLVQGEPSLGRGYRHYEPWPTRVAANHAEGEAEEEDELETSILSDLRVEGSGLGSELDQVETNCDQEKDEQMEDNLEQLYTTIASENFNMWTDGWSKPMPTTTTTKLNPPTDLLEQYIREHKQQTIDTNEEKIKNYTPTTTTTSTTTSTTTTTTIAPTIAPTIAHIEDDDDNEEEEEKGEFELVKAASRPINQNEQEEVSVIASPPRPLSKLYQPIQQQQQQENPFINKYQPKQQQQEPKSLINEYQPKQQQQPKPLINEYQPQKQQEQKLLRDNDYWFRDDDLPASLERLLMKSQAEDDADLISLYNAEEPTFPTDDYNYRERMPKPLTPKPINLDYQQPWSVKSGDEFVLDSTIDDENVPQFIEQLMGHLGKMSRLFSRPATTYHHSRIPGAIYPASQHNHLTNFRDTYNEDEHPQLAAATSQIAKQRIPILPALDAIPWFNEQQQPKELQDAVTIFNILFPRN